MTKNITEAALKGEGPRPSNPYVGILWAQARGVGTTLSPDEVHEMRFDDAIETRANYVVGETVPYRPNIPVEDSLLWTPEQRRLAQFNKMDAFGTCLGWKD